jgi:hypothetical protein
MSHRGNLSIEGPLTVGGDKSRNWQWAGSIDEVEMFNRGLAPEEILSLYNAREQGKCRLSSSLPLVTAFCANDQFVTVEARICNPAPDMRTVFYTLQGLPIGPGCNFSGQSASFSPSSGSVVVPPRGCVTVPVQISKPAGMPCDTVACYEIRCQADTGEMFVSDGSLRSQCDLCVTVPLTSFVLTGLAALQIEPFTIVNTGPTLLDLSGARLAVYGSDGKLDTSVVSLNGHQPGPIMLPVGIVIPAGAGELGRQLGLRAAGNPPANGSLDLTVHVAFTSFQPGQSFTLVLEADLDGDESLDALASAKLWNEIAPPQRAPLGIARNADGTVTLTRPSEDWTLEASDEITGPFSEVPGIGDSRNITMPVNGTTFYRLRMP